ncbi:MAG: DUF1385 domain-containing protein [Bacillota bacterium]
MSKKQYGGQAVIEGVMMKGEDRVAIAVRKKEGDIKIKEEDFSLPGQRFSFLGWPFIRGVVSLIFTLVLGIRSLSFSANEAAEDEDEEIKTWEMVVSILVAFGLAILFFVMLPAGIISLIQARIDSNLILNLIEGLIKITAFIAYVYFISRMEDIKRVFMYHGAEHKVIHNYESDKPLSVENAREFTTLHPRCGTSFLFLVILLSIFFFSFFGRPAFFYRILYHLMLLPLIAGTSYELIKLAGKENAGFLVKILSWPGLAIQKLTTSEPDDSMLEVAIMALNHVLPEKRGEKESV